MHALITMFSLGKLPIVVFFHIRIQGIIAFGLWMAYTVALYGITLVYENDKKLSNRDIFNAIGFGMLLAVIKGSLDTIGEMIYTYENRFIAIETQIELLIFGVILFLVLQLKVAKKKNLGYYTEYKHYAATEMELYNLDLYIAMNILNHNVWSYAILYILFWWFLKRVTVAKERRKG